MTCKKKNLIKILLLSAILSIFFVAGCDEEQKDDQNISGEEKPLLSEKLDIFTGSWESKEFDAVFTETWNKNPDGSLSGAGVSIYNDTVVFTETLSFRLIRDTTYYVVNIPDQNEGKDVMFRMTKCEDSLFVFENRAHDYPQVITYKFFKKDSARVTLEGSLEVDKSELLMKRVKR
ncbi:MAG: hypothetical protein A2W91_01050 [Bacteroidetes bacterium GWF2_38_335]|nr:MAG: hypothetical protein A2W91_01050 [Bacteroidetes bacterium GWF2_38_335]OFY80341.1 MAG: hypothetical protein A2281_17560 [Bacteroidetes bacterium RIFOXYA12_FULL_38_20]HBS88858.1 hypothetical protein [Bacteroidales bacterium]